MPKKGLKKKVGGKKKVVKKKTVVDGSGLNVVTKQMFLLQIMDLERRLQDACLKCDLATDQHKVFVVLGWIDCSLVCCNRNSCVSSNLIFLTSIVFSLTACCARAC
jgi:hypothetical protein